MNSLNAGRDTKTMEQLGDKTRCWWCGKKTGEPPRDAVITVRAKEYLFTVCSEPCERALVDAYASIKRRFPLFITGIVAGLLVMVVLPLFFRSHWGMVAGFFLIGTTIMLCPCATPQTVELMGMKRSFALVRCFGAAYVIAAVVIGWHIA